MRKLITISSLMLCTSAIATTSWSIQFGLDQPYFSSASTSTVNIQQLPASPDLTPVVNTNHLDKANIGFDASGLYHWKQISHWQINLGLNIGHFLMPVSGEGNIGTFNLDQYHYNVSIDNADALINLDYLFKRWQLGANILLGTSRLHAENFQAADPKTTYADKTLWRVNYGAQLHALYRITPHILFGAQAAYRDDGMSELGTRANVYYSIGSIKQKVHVSYIGLLLGLQY